MLYTKIVHNKLHRNDSKVDVFILKAQLMGIKMIS